MIETVTVLKQILQVSQGVNIDELPLEVKEVLKSIRGDSIVMKMDTTWKELQQHVDHVLDRDMNKNMNKASTWGFKQVIIEKY